MRLEQGEGPIVLVLSRRNLASLLAKLDGHPPGSACRLLGGTEAARVLVVGEPDETHYAHRSPGRMHPDTEAAINGSTG